MSIFSNISHLEWRAELSDTILKGTHPGTIPARLSLIWFGGFRGEDLNVKVYGVWRTDGQTNGRWMPSDGKSSHGLWPGELKTIIRWIYIPYTSFLQTLTQHISKHPDDQSISLYRKEMVCLILHISTKKVFTFINVPVFIMDWTTDVVPLCFVVKVTIYFNIHFVS